LSGWPIGLFVCLFVWLVGWLFVGRSAVVVVVVVVIVIVVVGGGGGGGGGVYKT